MLNYTSFFNNHNIFENKQGKLDYFLSSFMVTFFCKIKKFNIRKMV